VAYKYGTYDSVGKNWITAGDFPLKVAQMDGKTFDILVVDDETGEVLGKPTIGSCEHSFYYTQRSYYNAEETGAARKRQRVPGGMPGLHHRRWR